MYRYVIFATLAFTPLLPHASADDVLEEIVVTAGFRDVELMKSAGSTSVLGPRLIEDRAARHFEDTINVLPNVNFSAGGTRARFVQVRGVGDLEQFVDPKRFPSVGITIDEVEVGTTSTAAALMDVAQVELLRGPQGTRFGANALAGIINIKTNEPTENFEARLESGYGNLDTWHLGASVSGPLSKKIQGRLAVQQYRSDGHYRNDFLDRDDNNQRDELAVRGKLHWSGDNGAALDLVSSYTDVDGGYDAFSLDNQRNTLSDNPGHDRQEVFTLAAKGSLPVTANLGLETIASWRGSDEEYAFDEDWVFAGFCDGIRCDPLFEFSSTDALLRESDTYALDTRLKSDPAVISWVAGIYLQKREEDLQRQHFVAFSSNYESERYAVYGELEIEMRDDLQVTAGFRFEHFRDDYNDSNLLLTKSSDSYWSGQLKLEYFHSENTLFYASLARSVKPGGVNTETSSSFPIINPTFRPFLQDRRRFAAETLFNREIGIKGSYFNKRLSARLSLFHMHRNNAQLESFVWDASTFIFTGFLDSSSDAENYGLELEAKLQVTDRLDVFTNLGVLETSVDELTVFDLDSSQFLNRRNRDQAKAPNWQYNLGMNLALNDALRARVEVEGRSDSFFGYYHDGQINDYALAHASVNYRVGKLGLQAWVRNIFDKDYAVHGLYFANDPRDGFAVNRSYYQFGEPRAYGVNLSYTF